MLSLYPGWPLFIGMKAAGIICVFKYSGGCLHREGFCGGTRTGVYWQSSFWQEAHQWAIDFSRHTLLVGKGKSLLEQLSINMPLYGAKEWVCQRVKRQSSHHTHTSMPQWYRTMSSSKCPIITLGDSLLRSFNDHHAPINIVCRRPYGAATLP